MLLPTVGITCDIENERATARTTYSSAVLRAGGLPLLLPPHVQAVEHHAQTCDAFVFTGGDDPAMEPFGKRTDPRVTLVHPDRQAYEMALLQHLADKHPEKPVLGVCLGMQMMALVAGGNLYQYMPESHKREAPRHWDNDHSVIPESGASVRLEGVVRSRHKQAVSDPGSLSVIAKSDDNLIEAIADTNRPFYVGVQWHPERTTDSGVGDALFQQLLRAVMQVPW